MNLVGNIEPKANFTISKGATIYEFQTDVNGDYNQSFNTNYYDL